MQELIEKETVTDLCNVDDINDIDIFSEEHNQTIYYEKDGVKRDLRKDINYLDEDMLNFLCKGEYFTDIFQVSSETPRYFFKTIFKDWYLLNKDNLTEESVVKIVSDIIAMIRPACVMNKVHERYYSRLLGKKTKTPISVDSPFYEIFSKNTESTFLEVLYQEQIMKILESAFDISAGKADNLRRLFEKKDVKKIIELKKDFWNIWKHKSTAEQAGEFWNWLIDVTGYAFNLSHSLSYALNLLQTAYIKRHLAVLIAVSLDHNYTDPLKVEALIKECVDANIILELPKLNKTFHKTFPILNNENKFDKISISPKCISGIGLVVSSKLSSIKNIKDLDVFVNKARRMGINKKVISILIDIDYFSEFGTKSEIYEYMSNAFITETYTEEGKFIKKYGKSIYKPKKNEEIISEDNGIFTIKKQTKAWDLKDIELTYFRNDAWTKYKIEEKYLGFALTPLSKMYNIEDGYTAIKVNSSSPSSKGSFKWTNIYLDEKRKNKLFAPNVTLNLSNNTVISCKLVESPKGLKAEDVKVIDIL